ncbi:hypothetical protein VTK26DRAFT_1439 [Humicola hyalothermophila]
MRYIRTYDQNPEQLGPFPNANRPDIIFTSQRHTFSRMFHCVNIAALNFTQRRVHSRYYSHKPPTCSHTPSRSPGPTAPYSKISENLDSLNGLTLPATGPPALGGASLARREAGAGEGEGVGLDTSSSLRASTNSSSPLLPPGPKLARLLLP